MSRFRRRIISSIGWSSFSHIADQIMNFIIIMILSWLLTPAQFGLVGMVTVFTNFAIFINSFGLGEAVIQKQEVDDVQLNTVFWINLLVGALLTVIFILLKSLIADFYNEPALDMITFVISFNFLILSVKSVQRALIIKKMDFRTITKVDLLAQGTAGIIAISCVFLGLGVWSLVVRALSYSLFIVILLWYYSNWRPKLVFDLSKVKTMIKFGVNLMGSNVSNYWSNNMDNLLIGKFIGAFSLGIYSRAFGLMLLPIRQFSNVLAKVMFPALSSINDDIIRVKSIFLRTTRAIALVSFPLMVGVIVLAKPLILFLFGERWGDVIPLIQVLSFTGLLLSISMAYRWIYMSQGKTDLLFRFNLFEGIIRIIAIVIGLKWGITGVAIAITASSYFIIWFPSWKIPGKLINLTFIEMVKNLSGPFVGAISMGIAIRGCYIILSRLWNYPSIILGILVPFGIIFYLLFVKLFKIKSFTEIKELISKELKNRTQNQQLVF
jgi:O-antigen/teichoic acid export membrane protein